jgi:hypothetical protein
MTPRIFIFGGILLTKILHVIRPAQGGMKKHLETLFQGLEQDRFDLYLAAPASSDLSMALRGTLVGQIKGLPELGSFSVSRF